VRIEEIFKSVGMGKGGKGDDEEEDEVEMVDLNFEGTDDEDEEEDEVDDDDDDEMEEEEDEDEEMEEGEEDDVPPPSDADSDADSDYDYEEGQPGLFDSTGRASVDPVRRSHDRYRVEGCHQVEDIVITGGVSLFFQAIIYLHRLTCTPFLLVYSWTSSIPVRGVRTFTTVA
jgi:hypothetical protein